MDLSAADGSSTPPHDRPRNKHRRGGPAVAPVTPLLQFHATAPSACPYLRGRAERKLVIALEGAAFLYADLSRSGFRRSHNFAYRPACRGCSACVPVRIAVERFCDNRWTRRIRNTNQDLAVRFLPARATVEQFRLFWSYQHLRHSDSEMATMDYRDYRSMVEESPVRTEVAEIHDKPGRLLAASLIDRVDDGISAVYSFFDPHQRKRSLGSLSILWLVDECRRQGAPYVYLGYWIAESPKMAYKARFPALEHLTSAGWNEMPRRSADG
jgi:leucyl-tRNA---protein transferase